jgi:hypothetical protein
MVFMSRISGWEITEQASVVSLLNTGSKLTGHALIVVEMVKNNIIFVGQYEVKGKYVVDETMGDFVQRTTGNAQGYIAKIEVFENGEYTRDYSGYSHKSWYATPDNVQLMIQSIKTAKQTLEQAMERGEFPYKYQTAGSNRWWLLGGNGGESCVTWAEKQLAIAQVGNSYVLADLIKALPELHTDCVIS